MKDIQKFASSEQNYHLPQLRIGRLIEKNKGIIKIRYTLGKIIKNIYQIPKG